MSTEVKATTRRVLVAEPGKPLVVEEVPTPEPKPGEILVKVAASPINPSDYLFTLGAYPAPGRHPGLEGSGVVVKSGGSERGNGLLGKRVAALGGGLWSEYTIINENMAYEIAPEADLKKAACSFVNPLTVVAMIKQIKRDGHKAVVHNAGASALGRQLIQSIEKEGLKSINVVRKQEQVEQLQKEFPYAVFLNSTTPDFDEQLKKHTTELGATICFDAVGGEMTGRILRDLPDRSVVYVYGLLSGAPAAGITADDLIFKGKRVEGFWLMNFLNDQEFRESIPAVVYNLPSNLQTNIGKEFGLSQANEAVQYMVANASSGKVIINPEL